MTDLHPLTDYDALLVLSFGGPEGNDEVVPFLENVTRGRGIPRERLEEVRMGRVLCLSTIQRRY